MIFDEVTGAFHEKARFIRESKRQIQIIIRSVTNLEGGSSIRDNLNVLYSICDTTATILQEDSVKALSSTTTALALKNLRDGLVTLIHARYEPAGVLIRKVLSRLPVYALFHSVNDAAVSVAAEALLRTLFSRFGSLKQKGLDSVVLINLRDVDDSFLQCQILLMFLQEIKPPLCSSSQDLSIAREIISSNTNSEQGSKAAELASTLLERHVVALTGGNDASNRQAKVAVHNCRLERTRLRAYRNKKMQIEVTLILDMQFSSGNIPDPSFITQQAGLFVKEAVLRSQNVRVRGPQATEAKKCGKQASPSRKRSRSDSNSEVAEETEAYAPAPDVGEKKLDSALSAEEGVAMRCELAGIRSGPGKRQRPLIESGFQFEAAKSWLSQDAMTSAESPGKPTQLIGGSGETQVMASVVATDGQLEMAPPKPDPEDLLKNGIEKAETSTAAATPPSHRPMEESSAGQSRTAECPAEPWRQKRAMSIAGLPYSMDSGEDDDELVSPGSRALLKPSGVTPVPGRQSLQVGRTDRKRPSDWRLVAPPPPRASLNRGSPFGRRPVVVRRDSTAQGNAPGAQLFGQSYFRAQTQQYRTPGSVTPTTPVLSRRRDSTSPLNSTGRRGMQSALSPKTPRDADVLTPFGTSVSSHLLTLLINCLGDCANLGTARKSSAVSSNAPQDAAPPSADALRTELDPGDPLAQALLQARHRGGLWVVHHHLLQALRRFSFFHPDALEGYEQLSSVYVLLAKSTESLRSSIARKALAVIRDFFMATHAHRKRLLDTGVALVLPACLKRASDGSNLFLAEAAVHAYEAVVTYASEVVCINTIKPLMSKAHNHLYRALNIVIDRLQGRLTSLLDIDKIILFAVRGLRDAASDSRSEARSLCATISKCLAIAPPATVSRLRMKIRLEDWVRLMDGK
eukprot:Protomagalhaensia_sp_Gyna_25__4665@NODE_43_length_6376_cov_123_651570_g32_i0_p1_GENE_NODE_43_length_6376_cov_123_651570_g32_i0NODE_43_length_6376_cov_123_651570_g32_i0_p1_ORF_typecomplete_len913_score119_72CLASP_N/PF12348_8/9_8e02CLASP_N/PF12348_8/3_4e11_NODE_43_length_6376_cov_123_651570_g32_i018664604